MEYGSLEFDLGCGSRGGRGFDLLHGMSTGVLSSLRVYKALPP